MPVAVNGCDVPFAIAAFEGVTSIASTLASVTVSVVVAVTPASVAVIAAVPTASPVATPLRIAATAAAEDAHTTCAVTSSVVSSEYRPLAPSWISPWLSSTGVVEAAHCDHDGLLLVGPVRIRREQVLQGLGLPCVVDHVSDR